MNKFLSFSFGALALAALTACGGGGDSAGSGGGTSNTNLTISLSGTSDTILTAGQNLPIKAVATAKGTPVTGIKWTVTALDGQADTSKPIVADATCENFSRSGGGAVNGVSTNGNASCDTFLTVPTASVSGRWEVKALASSASASAYDSFKVTTGASSGSVNVASGFAAVLPTRPIQVVGGEVATVTASYKTKAGVTVTDVKYAWTVTTGSALLAGANTEAASFITTAGTSYGLNLKITAKVNGVDETAEGSAVVVATTASSQLNFEVEAGPAAITNTNAVTTLTGKVTTNSNSSATPSNFKYQWKQLSGPSVSISNENSLIATFIPKEVGMYEFELTVSNENATKKAKTQVGVNTITVSAGDVQIIDPTDSNQIPVVLKATTTGTGSLISYQWTQTAGPNVLLANATTPQASFNPSIGGEYRFSVVATADGISQVAHTLVYVRGNPLPVSVSAGNVQVVRLPLPTQVLLTAATVGNVGQVKYQWSQTGGPAVVLGNSTSRIASFAPTITGVYSFSVTATADGVSSTSNTMVYVETPPSFGV